MQTTLEVNIDKCIDKCMRTAVAYVYLDLWSDTQKEKDEVMKRKKRMDNCLLEFTLNYFLEKDTLDEEEEDNIDTDEVYEDENNRISNYSNLKPTYDFNNL